MYTCLALPLLFIVLVVLSCICGVFCCSSRCCSVDVCKCCRMYISMYSSYVWGCSLEFIMAMATLLYMFFLVFLVSCSVLFPSSTVFVILLHFFVLFYAYCFAVVYRCNSDMYRTVYPMVLVLFYSILLMVVCCFWFCCDCIDYVALFEIVGNWASCLLVHRSSGNISLRLKRRPHKPVAVRKTKTTPIWIRPMRGDSSGKRLLTSLGGRVAKRRRKGIRVMRSKPHKLMRYMNRYNNSVGDLSISDQLARNGYFFCVFSESGVLGSSTLSDSRVQYKSRFYFIMGFKHRRTREISIGSKLSRLFVGFPLGFNFVSMIRIEYHLFHFNNIVLMRWSFAFVSRSLLVSQFRSILLHKSLKSRVKFDDACLQWVAPSKASRFLLCVKSLFSRVRDFEAMLRLFYTVHRNGFHGTEWQHVRSVITADYSKFSFPTVVLSREMSGSRFGKRNSFSLPRQFRMFNGRFSRAYERMYESVVELLYCGSVVLLDYVSTLTLSDVFPPVISLPERYTDLKRIFFYSTTVGPYTCDCVTNAQVGCNCRRNLVCLMYTFNWVEVLCGRRLAHFNYRVVNTRDVFHFRNHYSYVWFFGMEMQSVPLVFSNTIMECLMDELMLRGGSWSEVRYKEIVFALLLLNDLNVVRMYEVCLEQVCFMWSRFLSGKAESFCDGYVVEKEKYGGNGYNGTSYSRSVFKQELENCDDVTRYLLDSGIFCSVDMKGFGVGVDCKYPPVVIEVGGDLKTKDYGVIRKHMFKEKIMDSLIGRGHLRLGDFVSFLIRVIRLRSLYADSNALYGVASGLIVACNTEVDSILTTPLSVDRRCIFDGIVGSIIEDDDGYLDYRCTYGSLLLIYQFLVYLSQQERGVLRGAREYSKSSVEFCRLYGSDGSSFVDSLDGTLAGAVQLLGRQVDFGTLDGGIPSASGVKSMRPRGKFYAKPGYTDRNLDRWAQGRNCSEWVVGKKPCGGLRRPFHLTRGKFGKANYVVFHQRVFYRGSNDRFSGILF